MTELKLRELLHEAKRIIDEEEDSLTLFKNHQQRWLEKQIVGVER